MSRKRSNAHEGDAKLSSAQHGVKWLRCCRRRRIGAEGLGVPGLVSCIGTSSELGIKRSLLGACQLMCNSIPGSQAQSK